MIELMLGFIAGVAFTIMFGVFVTKLLIKKGWYASALWNNKYQRWEVKGSYLMIASKIIRHIRKQDDKVKYIY